MGCVVGLILLKTFSDSLPVSLTHSGKEAGEEGDQGSVSCDLLALGMDVATCEEGA